MKWVIFLSLFIVTVYRCFFNLNQQPIERWDEQTNISIITETNERKSFPILYLSNAPFFEKPPFWYYLSLVFTPRMTSALAGFLVILITAYFSYRWWGFLSSIITWIILISTNHLFVTNPAGIFSTHTFRSADVDSLFILFLLLSFVTNNYLSGIFAGLAVLTKGPLGVLPLLIKKTPVTSWIIAMIVIFPWYIFMTGMFGMQFWQEHLGYHTITRVLSPIEGHNNPLWYYATIVTNKSFFLFSELLLLSIILNIVRYRHDAKLFQVTLITILLFIIPSFSQTRLAWYILPLYPFAALTIAGAMVKLLK